jgi:Mrp family chromosome partitioning ATPase
VRPAAEADARRSSMGGTLRWALAATGFWPGGTAARIPVLAVLPVADVSFGLSEVDDPASPFAREIRKIYDEVRASHMTPGNPSVLVVACDDEDDAATVTLALAALAAATQRVLVIDTDLERRTLSAIDAEDSEAGLVDVAVGRRPLSDAITLDRDTNINLIAFVAPASRRDRRIYDADIRKAFDQTKRYDMVIVAAMNVSGDPSVGFFADLVDHIVLVARAGAHDEATLAQVIARLGLNPQKVRGAVLTGAEAA